MQKIEKRAIDVADLARAYGSLPHLPWEQILPAAPFVAESAVRIARPAYRRSLSPVVQNTAGFGKGVASKALRRMFALPEAGLPTPVKLKGLRARAHQIAERWAKHMGPAKLGSARTPYDITPNLHIRRHRARLPVITVRPGLREAVRAVDRPAALVPVGLLAAGSAAYASHKMKERRRAGEQKSAAIKKRELLDPLFTEPEDVAFTSEEPEAPVETPAEEPVEERPEYHEPLLKRASGWVEVFVTPKGKKPVSVFAQHVTKPDDLRRGLMFRTKMRANEGMLFDAGRRMVHSLWMKNTFIPLDMVFIRRTDDETKGMKVVGVVHEAKPLSEEPRGVSEASDFALEVPGGFCRRHGISEGGDVEFGARL